MILQQQSSGIDGFVTHVMQVLALDTSFGLHRCLDNYPSFTIVDMCIKLNRLSGG